jgi:hypothetical protein
MIKYLKGLNNLIEKLIEEKLFKIIKPLYILSSRRDLNPRPLPYQGNALPTELRGQLTNITISLVTCLT